MTRSSRPSTHDDDFFAWTQEQAAMLRRLPPAAIGSAIDIAQVAEEIEDLGKRDLREVESCLKRFFEHLIKIVADKDSRDGPHWSSEALHFRETAAGAFSAGMRQKLDLEKLWSGGAKIARVYLVRRGLAPAGISSCPFALDDLLSDDFDLEAALARIAALEAEAGTTSDAVRR